MSEEQPAQLGPYRLIRRLGHGGMAEVYLAEAVGASGFEKRVAIKTLRRELRGSGELERLLIEEARLGARLSHRNLVAVHDLGVDDGAYYVRMDHVDGADLGTLIGRERPSLPLALFVVEEVLLGLSYMHGFSDEKSRGRPLGLVHRDLSPSNVLVSRAGEVKLCDFGIAKATHLAEVTRGNVRKGTYAYMSPEQVGGGWLTAQSDQFSLGIMLTELTLGRRPFDGDTPHATMERIRRADPPDLSALPPPLAAIILRTLRPAPEERFPSVEAMRRELAALRRELDPVGPPDLAELVRSVLAP